MGGRQKESSICQDLLDGNANPPRVCQESSPIHEVTWTDRPIQVRNLWLASHASLAVNTTPPTLVEKGPLLRHWRGKSPQYTILDIEL